jgi:hypothetical protein
MKVSFVKNPVARLGPAPAGDSLLEKATVTVNEISEIALLMGLRFPIKSTAMNAGRVEVEFLGGSAEGIIRDHRIGVLQVNSADFATCYIQAKNLIFSVRGR